MAPTGDQANQNKRAAHHGRRAQRYVVVVRGTVPADVIDKISSVHALAIGAREEAGRQWR